MWSDTTRGAFGPLVCVGGAVVVALGAALSSTAESSTMSPPAGSICATRESHIGPSSELPVFMKMLAKRFWDSTDVSCDDFTSYMAGTTVGQYLGIKPPEIDLQTAVQHWMAAEIKSNAVVIAVVVVLSAILILFSFRLAMFPNSAENKVPTVNEREESSSTDESVPQSMKAGNSVDGISVDEPASLGDSVGEHTPPYVPADESASKVITRSASEESKRRKIRARKLHWLIPHMKKKKV